MKPNKKIQLCKEVWIQLRILYKIRNSRIVQTSLTFYRAVCPLFLYTLKGQGQVQVKLVNQLKYSPYLHGRVALASHHSETACLVEQLHHVTHGCFACFGIVLLEAVDHVKYEVFAGHGAARLQRQQDDFEEVVLHLRTQKLEALFAHLSPEARCRIVRIGRTGVVAIFELLAQLQVIGVLVACLIGVDEDALDDGAKKAKEFVLIVRVLLTKVVQLIFFSADKGVFLQG